MPPKSMCGKGARETSIGCVQPDGGGRAGGVGLGKAFCTIGVGVTGRGGTGRGIR